MDGGSPSGPIARFLAADHRRIDALLARTIIGTAIVEPIYDELRGLLLRHIGLEEKILFPAAKRLPGGVPLPDLARLRRDHSALAALLVPTPTPEIIATLQALLERHNAIEERPGGVYALCEQAVGAEADRLLEAMRAAPAVPLARHFDGPSVHERIAVLLRAAEGGERSNE